MEVWKPVLGYEGLYSVSNFGRIRRETTRTRAKAGAIKKEALNVDNYPMVCLSRPGDKQRSIVVHRLVWEAFHGPREPGITINHKDGVRWHNWLHNLEAITIRANIRHSIEELGYDRKGASNPASKLSEKEVVEIRVLRSRGAMVEEIAEDYDITPRMAALICQGKAWANTAGPITPARPVSQTGAMVQAKHSDTAVIAVIHRYMAGESTSVLAAELGVTKRTLLNWAQGKTRPHLLRAASAPPD